MRPAAPALAGRALRLRAGTRASRRAARCSNRCRSGPLRSKASSAVTCSQPVPSCRSARRRPARTSSKKTSQKCASPVRSSIGRTVTPGSCRSTMNCDRPLLPVLRRARGAHQRDHVVRLVRVGGPDLLAVQAPAGLGRASRACCTLARSEPALRLAHADAEEQLAAADARQVERFCASVPYLQDQRRALAVGDPVRRHRRAGRQQFLDQHEAGERIAAAAAVFLGQRQADPALAAELAAEAAVVAGPGPRADMRRHVLHGLGQEFAHRRAQRLVLGRNGGQLQRIECAHCTTPSSISEPITSSGKASNPDSTLRVSCPVPAARCGTAPAWPTGGSGSPPAECRRPSGASCAISCRARAPAGRRTPGRCR